MVGVTLSADDIRAAPPEVRRWLDQQVVRKSEPGLRSNAATRPPPPEVQREDGISQEAEAARKAAIQKLIAERAYELWENHGRPHGFDLIQWREAEQEIMACLEHGSVPHGAEPPATDNRRRLP
jgi:hypothetical protein